MSSAAQNRREAASKRDERETRKRQKELERMHKELAKLTLLEQAQLDVATFENSIDILVSIHKESSPKFDWMEALSTLPPHAPLKMEQQQTIASFLALSSEQRDLETTLANARAFDEDSFAAARTNFEAERDECLKMRSLAKRVLAGELEAYIEALTELSVFGELANLGSSITFRANHAKLITCELSVNGRDAIPAEVKALTAAGKVSVKSMPKGRFHEIYQDYVCGCSIRVAREVLALLPVDTVIVTASIRSTQANPGRETSTPVLSVAIPRYVCEHLDFNYLDPSDSMENFVHRGDVLASRKSGQFVAIVPLNPEDVDGEPNRISFADMLNQVRSIRAEIASRLSNPL